MEERERRQALGGVLILSAIFASIVVLLPIGGGIEWIIWKNKKQIHPELKLSGDVKEMKYTNFGEEMAIRLRRKELKQNGYSDFFTRYDLKTKNVYVDPLQQLTGARIVDLRSDRVRALEMQAQSSLSSEDEEIAHRLLTLCQQANALYRTDQEAYDRTASEIKSIGEHLCSNGGDDRMQLLSYRLYALGGSGRQLEMYWDGVCGWQW